MILDCDFCPQVTQFKNREQAVDQGWNWQEAVVNEETFTVAACPDCDESQVKDKYQEKSEALKIVSEPGEEIMGPTRNEERLEAFTQ
jgi:hypothetical protein